MDFQKVIATTEIDKLAPQIKLLGEKIWKYSEKGCKETKSVKAITKMLKQRQFKITLQYKGMNTAFKAEYPENDTGLKGKTRVALLCQYDAFGKRGHAKGNNLISAMAVGAAIGIRVAIGSAATNIGKIIVIGCPNSSASGIITMTSRKAFKGIDVALSATPGPRTEWDPIYLGTRTLRATYTIGVNEEGQPLEDVNTVDAAVMAQTNIDTIREHFGLGWTAAGMIQAGIPSAPEKMPEETTSTIKFSAPSNKDLILMQKRITLCLEAAAKSSGCQLSVIDADKPYCSLITNTPMIYLLQLNAYYCGILATPLKPRLINSAEGVGNVSHVIPTIRPMYFIGTDAELGSREFAEASNTSDAYTYMIGMAKALAMTAIDIFHTKDTLLQCKEDLKTSLKMESKVDFKPFPTNRKPDFFLKMEVPGDSNTGWSRTI